MHVAVWFFHCCVPQSDYYLWWWQWNWPQWGVGATRLFVLEEGCWANGVQHGNVTFVDAWASLSSPEYAILVPSFVAKCSQRYCTLNGSEFVAKVWFVSGLSRGPFHLACILACAWAGHVTWIEIWRHDCTVWFCNNGHGKHPTLFCGSVHCTVDVHWESWRRQSARYLYYSENVGAAGWAANSSLEF